MVKCEENVGDDEFWSVWVGGIGNDNDGEVQKLCGGVNIAVHNKEEADGEFWGVCGGACWPWRLMGVMHSTVFGNNSEIQ